MEVWKDVVGYEGRYLVSSFGNLKSLKFRGVGGEWPMKATPNGKGYYVVTLGAERKQYRLHTLVLAAFVGPRPSGYQGCHCDNDKSNNRLDNLRWDTAAGNVADRRSYRGNANPNSKVDISDYTTIAQRRASGERLHIIGMDYGITGTRVRQIFKQVREGEK